MKFCERLKQLRKSRKLTQADLAKLLNVAQSTVGNWESGTREPDVEMIRRIADAIGIPVERFFSEAKDSTPEHSNTVQLAQTGVRMIPLYESAAAGFGAYANSTAVGCVPCYIESEWEAENSIAVKIKGDSMYPKIEDGDIVIICKDMGYEDGKIVVARIDEDDAVVKRLRLYPSKLVLESINPEYQDRVFEREEMNRVHIEGVVRTILKKA